MTPYSDPHAIRAEYKQLVVDLADHVRRARPVLLGFSTVLDAVHDLDANALSALEEAATTRGPLRSIAQAIWAPISAGRGGEWMVDSLVEGGWPDGARWLGELFPPRVTVGGNAGQAANVLSTLGASPLLALTDRSAPQLASLGERVRVVEPDGEVVLASHAAKRPSSARQPHQILEFQAGATTKRGTRIPRSDRVVLRFEPPSPQLDTDFAHLACQLAEQGGAGAALVSGLSKLTPRQAPEVLYWIAEYSQNLRRNGLPWLHLEMAYYPDLKHRARVLETLTPWVNSLGMNADELRALAGRDGDPVAVALELAQWYGLDRLHVHSDQWVLSVTKGDPERERTALLLSALVASCRAEAGSPVLPADIPVNAEIAPPDQVPSAVARRDGWSVTVAPTLYLRQPRGTVGLGDTFLSVCLAVLGTP